MDNFKRIAAAITEVLSRKMGKKWYNLAEQQKADLIVSFIYIATKQDGHPLQELAIKADNELKDYCATECFVKYAH